MEPHWKKQLPIIGCIYIGQLLVGYGMGWTAPVVLKLLSQKTSIQNQYITEDQISWIGSALYLGTILGPYIAAYLSDSKGRKPCLLLGGVVTLISFYVLAKAYNFALMIFGRILCGLGTGIVFFANLLYIGEIVSSDIKDLSVIVAGIVGTIGTFIVYTIGPVVSYTTTCYLAVCIAAVYIIGIYFIPETPVYQILKGRENEATETLLTLGRDDDVEEMLLTKLNIQWLWPRKKNQWRELFKIRSNRKGLMITLTLYIFQQMSGVISIIFFCTTIFLSERNKLIGPHTAATVLGITQIIASIVTPFFFERFGRKPLLLWSTASCSLSMAVLGVYFFMIDAGNPVVDYIQWLPLVALIVFFMSYDFGFSIVPSTFIGEMFLPNVRGTGSAITITISWLVGFGVTSAFTYMLSSNRSDLVFWIYSGSCAAAFFFTAKYVPETKEKTFMEIQEILSR